jgi:hypothetical protein
LGSQSLEAKRAAEMQAAEAKLAETKRAAEMQAAETKLAEAKHAAEMQARRSGSRWKRSVRVETTLAQAKLAQAKAGAAGEAPTKQDVPPKRGLRERGADPKPAYPRYTAWCDTCGTITSISTRADRNGNGYEVRVHSRHGSNWVFGLSHRSRLRAAHRVRVQSGRLMRM